MQISAASASIKVNFGNASPAVHIATNNVVCHLTKGFSAAADPSKYGHALNATGTFRIDVGPNDDISKWEFGFIQFMKVNDVTFIYAGETRDQGGIVISASSAPALISSTNLDSTEFFTPWTIGQPRKTISLGVVTCTTGDHPNLKAGRELANRLVGRVNYIYRVIDDRNFWTVLSAKDPAGNFQHLAHFTWSIRNDVKFQWRNDKPQVTSMLSKLTPKSPSSILGAPTDAVLKTLLADPKGPQANDLMTAAIIKAVNDKSGTNRKQTLQSEGFVPSDFFQA